MFSKFWKQNSELIQFLGIIIATGAIFLNIPKPDNSIAQYSLANIQFIWICVISLCIIYLGYRLLNLATLAEKTIYKTINFKAEGIIVWLIIGIGVYFIYNLYRFTLNQFPNNLPPYKIIALSVYFLTVAIGHYLYKFLRSRVRILISNWAFVLIGAILITHLYIISSSFINFVESKSFAKKYLAGNGIFDRLDWKKVFIFGFIVGAVIIFEPYKKVLLKVEIFVNKYGNKIFGRRAPFIKK